MAKVRPTRRQFPKHDSEISADNRTYRRKPPSAAYAKSLWMFRDRCRGAADRRTKVIALRFFRAPGAPAGDLVRFLSVLPGRRCRATARRSFRSRDAGRSSACARAGNLSRYFALWQAACRASKEIGLDGGIVCTRDLRRRTRPRCLRRYFTGRSRNAARPLQGLSPLAGPLAVSGRSRQLTWSEYRWRSRSRCWRVSRGPAVQQFSGTGPAFRRASSQARPDVSHQHVWAKPPIRKRFAQRFESNPSKACVPCRR